IGSYLVAAGLVVWLVGTRLGREIFPLVDSGQFQLRIRAPDGTRIERTEMIAKEALAAIQETVGADKMAMTVGFGGVSPSSYTINTVYLWTAGPEETVLRVALKPHSGIRVEDLKERLRRELPERLARFLQTHLREDGLAEDQI